MFFQTEWFFLIAFEVFHIWIYQVNFVYIVATISALCCCLWFNPIKIKRLDLMSNSYQITPGPQGRMKLSGPGTKSVKRRMFSNTSRLVTSLVGRALPSLCTRSKSRDGRGFATRCRRGLTTMWARLQSGWNWVTSDVNACSTTRGNARILRDLFKPLLFPIFSRRPLR